jgi:type III secretion system YscQ/HrcQ family protein
MKKKLRKYPWHQLPKVSRVQARVVNTLLTHLPQTPFQKGFKEKLRATLEPLVHADVDFWLDSVSVLEGGDLRKVIGHPTALALIGLVPKPEKILLEVDLSIAQLCIDRLLGGEATDVDAQRPLSEIEEGIFGFVMLKCLSLVQETMGGEMQLGLKMEALSGSLDMLADRFFVDARYVALHFKLFFDATMGTMRIFVPASLIETAFSSTAPSPGPALNRWLLAQHERRELIRLMKTPLAVEVGRLQLSMADIEGLGVDDIIVVEQTELKLSPGDEETEPTLYGSVQLRVGGGAHGVVVGSLDVSERGRYQVCVESLMSETKAAPMAFLFDGALRAGGDAESDYDEEGEASADVNLGMRADGNALRAAAAALLRTIPLRSIPLRTIVGAAAPAPLAFADVDADDAAEHNDEDEPPDADAMAMLGDVTVAMVIELGRVQVSAADVLGLRAGQVIELGRAPGEAIDLVVDGRRIGKGELVDIDGELGVRILSLTR